MQAKIERIIYNWLENIPEDTHEEYLSKISDYKEIIDKTPNKFLKFHLDDCIKKERYELAQYIKDKAISREFNLSGA
jgi:hypothetical protein